MTRAISAQSDVRGGLLTGDGKSASASDSNLDEGEIESTGVVVGDVRVTAKMNLAPRRWLVRRAILCAARIRQKRRTGFVNA